MFKETERPRHDGASPDDAAEMAEVRIEKLLSHLPASMAHGIRWLHKPAARWVRIPLAIALIFGGLLSFLPILGLWMLPLSLILLAEDIPILRRAVDRFINWLAGRKPRWFR